MLQSQAVNEKSVNFVNYEKINCVFRAFRVVSAKFSRYIKSSEFYAIICKKISPAALFVVWHHFAYFCCTYFFAKEEQYYPKIHSYFQCCCCEDLKQ